MGRHSHDLLFVHPVDVQHSDPRSGSVILCFLALVVVEIGRHSQAHLFDRLIDELCLLWIHDVSQPDLSHDGPCILHCLTLGIAEISKHSHDRVVILELDGVIFHGFLVILALVVVVRVGPPDYC